jgi:hypothetical protein
MEQGRDPRPASHRVSSRQGYGSRWHTRQHLDVDKHRAGTCLRERSGIAAANFGRPGEIERGET